MNDNSSKEGLDVRETGLISALWVTFSSMKTAIVLLLLLAVISVAGTLIPQGGPPDMYYQMYGPVKGWIINRF
ncbi:MAG: cytochrome c biogenesis protein ResB, partial [Armatimonadota bacterium]